MTNSIEKALERALSSKAKKSRIYVDSPEDVPDEYEVQEGSRGGYFYETDGSSDGGDDVSDRELPQTSVEVEQEVNRVMNQENVDPDVIADKVFDDLDPSTVEAGEPQEEFMDEYMDQMEDAVKDEFGDDNWEVFEDEVDYQAGELAEQYAPDVEQFWEPGDAEPEPF